MAKRKTKPTITIRVSATPAQIAALPMFDLAGVKARLEQKRKNAGGRWREIDELTTYADEYAAAISRQQYGRAAREPAAGMNKYGPAKNDLTWLAGEMMAKIGTIRRYREDGRLGPSVCTFHGERWPDGAHWPNNPDYDGDRDTALAAAFQAGYKLAELEMERKKPQHAKDKFARDAEMKAAFDREYQRTPTDSIRAVQLRVAKQFGLYKTGSWRTVARACK